MAKRPKAHYRLKLTVDVLGRQGKLEFFLNLARRALAAGGLHLSGWNIRWMNAEECNRWRPVKKAQPFDPRLMTAERSRWPHRAPVVRKAKPDRSRLAVRKETP